MAMNVSNISFRPIEPVLPVNFLGENLTELKIIDALSKNVISARAVDADQRPIIIIAAWLGWENAVEALLICGAEVEATYGECTPLTAAVLANRIGVVRLLLMNGAQPKNRNALVAFAKQSGFKRISSLLKKTNSI